MEYYISCLKNYAKFSGRARRKEYWMFALINGLICLILNIPVFVATIMGLDSLSSIFYAVYFIYCLAVAIPGLAVAVRRLHDVGKSGWMYLVCFIPIIGWLLILYYDVKEGDMGANQYGPNPKHFEGRI